MSQREGKQQSHSDVAGHCMFPAVTANHHPYGGTRERAGDAEAGEEG